MNADIKRAKCGCGWDSDVNPNQNVNHNPGCKTLSLTVDLNITL